MDKNFDSLAGNYRSSTIRSIYDIDVTAIKRGETLDQEFDPWRITEKELREFVGGHVKKSGNKRPLVTFSRRNKCHVNNHVYCNPADTFSHRERKSRDERYSILDTGIYEYHVENAERMSLQGVRLRIGAWIKRNCHVPYRTNYDPVTHIMTFYNPEFDPDEKERRQQEHQEELARIEADDRPEW